MSFRGDVKISNPVPFTMPTSSSPGRQGYGSVGHRATYLSSPSRSSTYRATSLDRAPLCRTYGTTTTRRMQLPPSYPINGTSMDSNRETNVDIISRISSIHSSGLAFKNLNARKGSSDIHDYSSMLAKPEDGLIHRHRMSIIESSKRNLSRTMSISGSSAIDTVPSSFKRLEINSLHSFSASSSDKNDLVDVNANGILSRTRVDSNYNLLSKTVNSDDDKTTMLRYRHQPSSSSSSSPGGSTDESFSAHRTRHGSTFTATTSGYGGQDNGSNTFGNRRNTSRDSMEKGGLVGLRNLGNTCFMNSVIQCLSNTKPLLEYCLKDSYLTECNVTNSSMKGALIKAFASLLHSMWKGSPDSATNPQLFKNQIQKFAPRFMGYNQQDAQEFLRYLLQGLHEDVNRVTVKPKPILTDIDETLTEQQKAAEAWRRYLRIDDSRIVVHLFSDIFVGQLRSCLQCTTCGHCSVTFDPFWDLSLPIPKAAGQVKLQQCFDLFTKEEVLDGDEKPTCSKCKVRRKCTKRMTIYKFPRILVIHLKRFSPMERYRSKLSTYVDFPVSNLDLSSYMSSTGKSQPCMYNLYAVSNHSGTIYSGHYTAYCKNPYTGDWHDFNDSRVSTLSANSVVSSEAYVLFYEITSHNSRL